LIQLAMIPAAILLGSPDIGLTLPEWRRTVSTAYRPGSPFRFAPQFFRRQGRSSSLRVPHRGSADDSLSCAPWPQLHAGAELHWPHAGSASAVIELFTSTGVYLMSSRDAYLAISDRSDVIALAFHRNYWTIWFGATRFALTEGKSIAERVCAQPSPRLGLHTPTHLDGARMTRRLKLKACGRCRFSAGARTFGRSGPAG